MKCLRQSRYSTPTPNYTAYNLTALYHKISRSKLSYIPIDVIYAIVYRLYIYGHNTSIYKNWQFNNLYHYEKSHHIHPIPQIPRMDRLRSHIPRTPSPTLGPSLQLQYTQQHHLWPWYPRSTRHHYQRSSTIMTLTQALNEVMPPITLDTMTDDQFDAFCDALPPRTLMLARSGLVSWQKVIDEWYPLLSN